MELRAIKYLVSLARTGSLSGAAAENFVSQPAVSVALRKLSAELGVRLYGLEGRRVVLTQAGKVVLEYAGKVEELLEELKKRVNDMKALRAGTLKIGTIDAASLYVLPEVFARFHSSYPEIEVQLEIAPTEVLLGSLEEDRIEAAIATLPVPDRERFEVFPIYSESMVLITPRNHTFSRRESVEAEELKGCNFIMFHKGAVTRRIIEDRLKEAGVELRVTMAIDSPEVITRLVSTGLGVSILPERIVEEELGRGVIAGVKVKGVSMERKLGLILKKGSYIPLHLKAFIHVMSDVMGLSLPDRIKLSMTGVK